MKKFLRQDYKTICLDGASICEIYGLARIFHRFSVKGDSLFVSDCSEYDEVIFENIAEEYFSGKMSKRDKPFHRTICEKCGLTRIFHKF